MNSALVALIMFLIVFFIIITVHQLGLDISMKHLYRMPFINKRHLTTQEKKLYDSTFRHIKLSKYITLDYKYVSEDLPSLFIFNPTLFERRSLALSNLKANLFQLHSNAFSIRPQQIKNRLLNHYRSIVKELNLKNVHLYLICSSVDTGAYIANQTKDITQSLIIDIPYHDMDVVFDNLLKFKWLKYFLIKPTEFPDPIKLDMKIMCITFDKEKHIDLAQSLKKLKSISDSARLRILRDIDMSDHAITYRSTHFVPTIQQWLNEF